MATAEAPLAPVSLTASLYNSEVDFNGSPWSSFLAYTFLY
jgi:hypothetical protein